ncbi:MAG: redoxin domain-containing protein [Myxococcales bacterium FL481]|nr:MAG: redoxin domain-containing protein [Myxococcales bacterium FL481]
MSFPLLADFHPKGQMASQYGYYLADKGITDRATVIVDKQGIVRYSASVGPDGERDIGELVAASEGVQREQASSAAVAAVGLPSQTTLYVRSRCGHSQRALLALENLHLRDGVTVSNVSEDAEAEARLQQLGGKAQAPCLVVDGSPVYEAVEITRALAERVRPLP